MADSETAQESIATKKPSPAQWRWWEDKAVWASIPFAGYYLAFRFQCGFCAAFNVPDYFVQVDLMGVLAFTSIMLVYSFFFLSLAEGFFELHSINRPGWPLLIKRYGSPLGLVLVFYFLSDNWIISLWLVGLLLAGLIGDFFRTRLRRDKTKTFLEDLSNGPGFFESLSPFSFVYNRFGSIALGFVLSVYAASLISWQTGHYTAVNRRTFLVPSTETNSVVVSRFGDKLICAGIEPKTMKVGKEVFILPVSEHGTKLELKTLGQLHFE